MMKGLRSALLLLCLLAAGLPALAADSPRVKFTTSEGDFVVELYPDKAPKTVANFLSYVDAGYYDGTIFHRVIRNFMIQGGGFTADFRRKATRAPVLNEADNGLKNERGTIAMARTFEPHSATAQFFINVRDNPNLDHTAPTPRGWGYAVFGRVVAGMDVVDRIRDIPTGAAGPFPGDVPRRTVVIKSVTRVTPAAEPATPAAPPKK